MLKVFIDFLVGKDELCALIGLLIALPALPGVYFVTKFADTLEPSDFLKAVLCWGSIYTVMITLSQYGG